MKLISAAVSFIPTLLYSSHTHNTRPRKVYLTPQTSVPHKTKLFGVPEVAFSKYEGLGNDFLLVDNRNSTTPIMTPKESSELCNRFFSVGANGVIFAMPPPLQNKEEYDISMRIYNSDGSEPEMCGNGTRCLAAFLHTFNNTQTSYRIHTLAGMIIPVINDDGSITVDMGEPILDAAKIPTTLVPNDPDGIGVLEQVIRCDNGKTWKVSAVSMGNPHAIVFVDDLEKDVDLETDGPAIECHPAFPAKTNVEFVQVMSEGHLKMSVWERGAGVTLACGTGACALVVAAIRSEKIPWLEEDGSKRVRVTLPGGDMFVEWRKSNNKVYMTGPAKYVYKGVVYLK